MKYRYRAQKALEVYTNKQLSIAYIDLLYWETHDHIPKDSILLEIGNKLQKTVENDNLSLIELKMYLSEIISIRFIKASQEGRI